MLGTAARDGTCGSAKQAPASSRDRERGTKQFHTVGAVNPRFIGIIPAIATPFALRGDKGAAQIAAVGFAALVFAYFWLSRFRLVIIQFRRKARLRQGWLSSFSLGAVGFLPRSLSA